MNKKYTAVTGLCLSLIAVVSTEGQAAEIHTRTNLNPVWRFQVSDASQDCSAADFDDSKWDIVSLPHSLELFNASLAGFKEHGRGVGWYRRELTVPTDWRGRKLFLEFRGAMEATELWVNGKKAGEYAVSGYDSFDFDITPFVKPGTNMIAVRVNNQVHPEIPPDGQEADYILFGGLYRDVFLHVTDPVHLTFPWEATQAGVRITLPEVSREQAVVQAEATVRNESSQPCKCVLVTELQDRDGKVVATMHESQDIPPGKEGVFTEKSQPVSNPHLWSPDNPYLYKVVTTVREGDHELDRAETPLGIRWVKFDKKEGFFLNGQHLKLVGANVHETWPFIGGAVPDGLHRRDAEQMKAMGVNWVRLSHYPQDPEFLNALDELGLMALEEPPTWMNPGPGKWMDNLEASERSMIRRDRNHPSIIIWNTSINHHPGDPRLIQAAIDEDPTRDRGQDTVGLPMTFQLGVVYGDGSLGIEHTGHTFPAQRGARAMTYRIPGKPKDSVGVDINREYDQVERHWEQVNAAYVKEDNAGLAVWCMYDYNTFHNANEPGMVWHGVCDLFRIPKFSYWWHVSELTSKPMAYVVRVEGTNAAVFSNCEEVRLWQDTGNGYEEVGKQKPDVEFTDPGGVEVKYALNHPPYHFLVSARAKALKAEGLIAGATKVTNEWRQFGSPVALTLEADRTAITADGADLSRIIVTAVDTNGVPVDNCNASVNFKIDGLGQLIGENPLKLRAGKMIILAQSGFVPGEITISAASFGLRSAETKVQMQPVGPDVDMPKDFAVKQPTKRFLAATPMPGARPLATAKAASNP